MILFNLVLVKLSGKRLGCSCLKGRGEGELAKSTDQEDPQEIFWDVANGLQLDLGYGFLGNVCQIHQAVHVRFVHFIISNSYQ